MEDIDRNNILNRLVFEIAFDQVVKPGGKKLILTPPVLIGIRNAVFTPNFFFIAIAIFTPIMYVFYSFQ